jgi:hypothetical protein
MAYMNQERKAVIAEKVKPILAKYGVKGTLKTDKYSITLTLKSGSIDFIGDLNSDRMRWDISKDDLRKDYNLSVNPYWFQEHYNGDSYFFLKEVIDALKAADWYDRSDAQVDYFDTAYYYNVNIGNWQKPYVVTN